MNSLLQGRQVETPLFWALELLFFLPPCGGRAVDALRQPCTADVLRSCFTWAVSSNDMWLPSLPILAGAKDLGSRNSRDIR